MSSLPCFSVFALFCCVLFVFCVVVVVVVFFFLILFIYFSLLFFGLFRYIPMVCAKKEKK